jgi:hypothetical protein
MENLLENIHLSAQKEVGGYKFINLTDIGYEDLGRYISVGNLYDSRLGAWYYGGESSSSANIAT